MLGLWNAITGTTWVTPRAGAEWLSAANFGTFSTDWTGNLCDTHGNSPTGVATISIHLSVAGYQLYCLVRTTTTSLLTICPPLAAFVTRVSDVRYEPESGAKADIAGDRSCADIVAKVENCRVTNFSRNYQTRRNRRIV
jgi:hypothetical protein